MRSAHPPTHHRKLTASYSKEKSLAQISSVGKEKGVYFGLRESGFVRKHHESTATNTFFPEINYHTKPRFAPGLLSFN